VISGTLAACVLTYEMIRRLAILRPLFGLRRGRIGAGVAACANRPAGAVIWPREEKC